MLQLNNTTRFTTAMFLFPDEQAIDTLYVVAKASFTMGETTQLCDKQAEVVEADIYWGDEPATSSLRYASDAHIGKPCTDIAMLGKACTIDQQPVQSLDVDLSVGQLHKTVRVFGDRYWRNGQITTPEPFSSMALVYEKSFGGQHSENDAIVATESRNPVGLGFAAARLQSEMEGKPLPNIENPSQLITRYTDAPAPAGFGFIAPFWSQRSGLAGTYDEQWQTTRAPYLPHDFKPKFLNMAAPDLIYPGYLTGGEKVSISHMHPSGSIEFTLPYINLSCRVDVSGTEYVVPFVIDTLLLEPNLLQYSLTLRAALVYGRDMLNVKHISVSLRQ